MFGSCFRTLAVILISDFSLCIIIITIIKAIFSFFLSFPPSLSFSETAQFKLRTSELPPLSMGNVHQMEEHRFWSKLKQTLLGCNVNCGESDRNLRRGLFKLRNRCVLVLFVLNTAWYAILTSTYVFASSDVVCYAIASLFSFSLIVQLIGMTSYKVEEFLKRYIVKKMNHSDSFWIREKS